MSRPAMRLLSPRLSCLRLHKTPLPVPVRQARCASRYSSPKSRSLDSDPQPSSFSTKARSSQTAFASADSTVLETADPSAYRRQTEEKRAHHVRRMRFAGIGLLLSVTCLSALLYNIDLDAIEKERKKLGNRLDAPQASNDQFQGKAVHIIGAGEDKRIISENEEELVETGTSSVPFFPKTITLPSLEAGVAASSPSNSRTQEEYTLLGLGIRTVTFLSIEVYVMGLYVRTQDLSALQSRLIHLINPEASTLVPAEKEQLEKKLLDPIESTEVWEKLLNESNVKSAWRITPAKNTDFGHLRDAWITGIKRGTQEAAAALKARGTGASETEYEDESFGLAVRDFKNMFTGVGRAPKGSVVMLVRDGAGSMEVLFQEQGKTQGLDSIGVVSDKRIGRLIWMNYLAGKNVSSEPARRNVVTGCLGIAARPVGSVETMVR